MSLQDSLFVFPNGPSRRKMQIYTLRFEEKEWIKSLLFSLLGVDSMEKNVNALERERDRPPGPCYLFFKYVSYGRIIASFVAETPAYRCSSFGGFIFFVSDNLHCPLREKKRII